MRIKRTFSDQVTLFERKGGTMFEECLAHYHRLQKLLEEDAAAIAYGLEGEVLDEYRATIKREADLLAEMVRMLYETYKK